MLKLKSVLFLVLFFYCSYSLLAQVTVSGKVIDAYTSVPLAGANLSTIGENKRGTTTDSDGLFSLVLPDETTSIRISYIGYDIVLLDSLSETTEVVIAMEPLELDPLGVGQVVVKATGPVVQAPVPVTNISKLDLQRDAGVAITPVLNRVPGVLMHTGALNTNRITIRGVGNRSPFGTAKIRAYLDEIPLTTGVGETTIEDIDLSLLESVSVWKGPSASAYGAALGGLISMKSGSLTSNQPPVNQLQINGLTGSYGLFRTLTNLETGSENFQLKLNYNTIHSDGYRENNEYDRHSFTMLAKQLSGDRKNTFSVLANYIDLKAFIPSSLNENDFNQNPRKAAFTWAQVRGFEDYEKLLVGVSNLHRFSNSITNTTSLFTTYRSSYESRPFNILREDNYALGGRTKWIYQGYGSKGDYQLSAGAEYFREQYDWRTNATNAGAIDTLLSDNNELRTYYNLFAEAEVMLSDDFSFQLGANFNQTQYDFTDLFVQNGDLSGEYSFDAVFSPRLSLKYELGSFGFLYGTISHGFSAPTLEETLLPDGSRNPDIQPEKGWNYELGMRALNWKRWTWDLTFYTMQIRDLLVARRTGLDQFLGINAGKTVHNGMELFLQREEIANIQHLSAYISYTYADYKFDEFVDGENDFSGNELTGTAPHLFRAGIDYRPLDGFYGNITYRFVDAMPLRDDNSIYSDAYQLVDLRAGYRLAVGKSWKIDAYGGIDNLLDKNYASMFLINAASFGGNAPRYFYPGLPRNYYAGLQIQFEW